MFVYAEAGKYAFYVRPQSVTVVFRVVTGHSHQSLTKNNTANKCIYGIHEHTCLSDVMYS